MNRVQQFLIGLSFFTSVTSRADAQHVHEHPGSNIEFAEVDLPKSVQRRWERTYKKLHKKAQGYVPELRFSSDPEWTHNAGMTDDNKYMIVGEELAKNHLKERKFILAHEQGHNKIEPLKAVPQTRIDSKGNEKTSTKYEITWSDLSQGTIETKCDEHAVDQFSNKKRALRQAEAVFTEFRNDRYQHMDNYLTELSHQSSVQIASHNNMTIQIEGFNIPKEDMNTPVSVHYMNELLNKKLDIANGQGQSQIELNITELKDATYQRYEEKSRASNDYPADMDRLAHLKNYVKSERGK